MDLASVALLVLGGALVVSGVLLFFYLRGLSRGTISVKYSFGLAEEDLEQLKQRAEFGAHWVTGTGFVVSGVFLIWSALSA